MFLRETNLPTKSFHDAKKRASAYTSYCFWFYFVLGTALTGTALTVLIGGIVINEQAKIKQVAPEKPDKQYPYEIDVGTLTKEECEKAGYRFTEMGLGLPNGELLNPGPNVRRVILRRNGGGEIVCILDARSRAE